MVLVFKLLNWWLCGMCRSFHLQMLWIILILMQ